MRVAAETFLINVLNGLPVVLGMLSLLFIAVLTILAAVVLYEEAKNDKKGA